MTIPSAKSGLRLAQPVRDQVEFRMACLDELIGADHRARLVWAYVERLDLSALYAKVRSFEDGPGAAQTDPRVLAALWLYATLEGIGSARHVARLCETDAAYRWILGGITTNHHTLSDFRTQAGEALDCALSASIASLAQTQLISLEEIAVDGVRVRAGAGKSSFKRKPALAALHEQASQHVAALKAELDLDPAASQKRVAARRKAAAEDRLARIEAAQASADRIAAERAAAAQKQRRKKPSQSGDDDRDGPSASTTDPDARIMRMADGGFRPAYNVQVTSETKTNLVIAVEPISSGGDKGRLGATVEAIVAAYSAAPERLLADGGYNAKTDIAARGREGVAVYCPLPENDRPRRGEDEEVARWRARMQSEEGRAVYARRMPCERPHADMRNRGLTQFLVRGRAKVKAVALWFAHAHNLLIWDRLLAQA